MEKASTSDLRASCVRFAAPWDDLDGGGKLGEWGKWDEWNDGDEAEMGVAAKHAAASNVVHLPVQLMHRYRATFAP